MNLLTIGGFLLKEAKVFHSQKHPWAWSTGWASCWLTWEGNVSFATISTIKHLSNNQHFNSHMFIIFALSNHLSQQAMAQVSNSPRNFLISDSGVFGPTLKDNNCVWVTDKGQQKQTILRFFKLTLSLTSSWHCSTHLHMSLYTWKGKTKSGSTLRETPEHVATLAGLPAGRAGLVLGTSPYTFIELSQEMFRK